jgi:hypothetical protein
MPKKKKHHASKKHHPVGSVRKGWKKVKSGTGKHTWKKHRA